MVERFLNCSECAGTRIGPTALQVFYSDFGETRRFSQLGSRPVAGDQKGETISGIKRRQLAAAVRRKAGVRGGHQAPTSWIS
jgi:hypothetical protein